MRLAPLTQAATLFTRNYTQCGVLQAWTALKAPQQFSDPMSMTSQTRELRFKIQGTTTTKVDASIAISRILIGVFLLPSSRFLPFASWRVGAPGALGTSTSVSMSESRSSSEASINPRRRHSHVGEAARKTRRGKEIRDSYYCVCSSRRSRLAWER